jgi:hypothetical protein
MYEYVSNEGLETGLGRDFSFSIVVVSTGSDRNDASEPITYIPTSRLLTVTTQCPPRMLVDFLRSEDALEASSQSFNKETDEYYEEQALELAREALGAKKLVRIMASYETGAVMVRYKICRMHARRHFSRIETGDAHRSRDGVLLSARCDCPTGSVWTSHRGW